MENVDSIYGRTQYPILFISNREKYIAHKLEKVGIDFSYEWGQTVKSRIGWLTEYMQTGVIKENKIIPVLCQ